MWQRLLRAPSARQSWPKTRRRTQWWRARAGQRRKTMTTAMTGALPPREPRQQAQPEGRQAPPRLRARRGQPPREAAAQASSTPRPRGLTRCRRRAARATRRRAVGGPRPRCRIAGASARWRATRKAARAGPTSATTPPRALRTPATAEATRPLAPAWQARPWLFAATCSTAGLCPRAASCRLGKALAPLPSARSPSSAPR
mmetsp:Transcript_10081/g.39268  ORF Transcript_10081/g.39268 Transcript_10081/m.39268 type:complete len:201 (+) Transcript_10081:56-658(+)